jgi:hypothetical protein
VLYLVLAADSFMAAAADERDAVRSPELEVFELEELPKQWRRSMRWEPQWRRWPARMWTAR